MPSRHTTAPSTAPEDRREWLRIDDRLPLEVRRPGDHDATEFGVQEPDVVASLNEFLTRPTQDLLLNTKPGDPQALLVPWMMKMDWTLGVLLQAVARLAQGGLPVPRMTDVNISATGMSFPTARAYTQGETLEVRLILPPFLPIQTGAEVARVSDLGDHPAGRYLVAVRFLEMRSDDQDQLIRHILQLQAERVRTRQRDQAA